MARENFTTTKLSFYNTACVKRISAKEKFLLLTFSIMQKLLIKRLAANKIAFQISHFTGIFLWEMCF